MDSALESTLINTPLPVWDDLDFVTPSITRLKDGEVDLAQLLIEDMPTAKMPVVGSEKLIEDQEKGNQTPTVVVVEFHGRVVKVVEDKIDTQKIERVKKPNIEMLFTEDLYKRIDYFVLFILQNFPKEAPCLTREALNEFYKEWVHHKPENKDSDYESFLEKLWLSLNSDVLSFLRYNHPDVYEKIDQDAADYFKKDEVRAHLAISLKVNIGILDAVKARALEVK